MGSFLNCVIYRIEKNQSFLKGRSYCPHCRHTLSWQDLIPVFSFLFFRGKCRYCHEKISLQYPLVELFTGVLFVLIFWSLGFDWSLGFLFLVSCFLIVIFIYDLRHYIIPDKILFPAIAIVFLYRLFENLIIGHWDLGFRNYVFAGLGASAFFLFIFFVSGGRWMGFGDVKLALFMGLFLGYPNILVALFLAFFLGAIIGVGLIIFGNKNLKSEVPFGPFLITGTFSALLWGQELMQWYTRLFLF